MKNATLNLNNARQGVNFKGKHTPDIDTLRTAKRFINCGLNNLEKNLTSSLSRKAPSLFNNPEGEKYLSSDTLQRKVISSLKTFFSIPVDIIDYFAKKHPNSPINNSKLLQKFRQSMQFEDEVRALQGLQENGMKFVQEVLPDKNYPTGSCDTVCQNSCNQVIQKFNKLLNDSMADDKAVYDTKKERFWARMVSGFTAALFLGNDFYNKAIQKGKSVEDAKKEQHLKQGQEIKENICEAITQFAVFACFSKAVNKSIWGSAVIGAIIGIVSRIISRLSSGMPIRRVKAPYQDNFKALSLNEYKNASKEGKVEETQKEKLKLQKTRKKPLLTAKNIILFCIASIASGYALRFLKGHTELGKMIAKKIQAYNDKIDLESIEEIVVPRGEMEKLENLLYKSNESSLSNYLVDLLNENQQASISLGKDYKTTKLILGMEVKTKDLKRLKTAPFRFLKELVAYPYKLASKLESSIRNAGSKQAIKPKDELITDPFEIKNLYKRFRDFERRYPNDDEKLREEFGKYLKKMRLLSNNNVTSSSCNNSKIAVVAQALGTLSGLYFNMNDEYNASIRNGSSKYTAEKEARLRGINKFFRMTVQLIISGSANDIFQKQYNSSLGAAAAVVAFSTILTDIASRALTGMPNRKMTKEELENYQKAHKEGAFAWYYKLIDKLAS